VGPRPDTTRDDGRPSRFERAVDRVPFLEKELFLLRRIVRRGDVCLDIGAAGGAHLIVMARRVGRRGQVVGIEPRPGSLRALRRLVRLTGLGGRVRLRQVALADREGSEVLRIPVVPTRAHLPGSTDAPEEAAAFAGLPHKEIEVPTAPLDRVVEEEGLDRVDVVKCDVEGAELLVIEGAERVLDTLRPIVIVEADDTHQQRFDATAQDVVDAVCRHGYRPYRYRRRRLEPVDVVVPDEDDYVLVPVERIPPLPVRGAV
jgi:FkbM family methyltransferase